MAELTIQFFDVGQGDGMYIVFPNGVNMLVDLGTTKNMETTSSDIFQYFKDHTRFNKVGQTLNYLIVTHPDRDHYNMVNGFIDELQPEIEWYTYGGAFKDFSTTSWMNKVEKTGAKFFEFSSRPAEIKRPGGFGKGVEVWCLACDVGLACSDKAWRKNSCSIVLQIVYNNIKVILAGDATFDTEKWMLGRFSKKPWQLSYLQSDVLKVAHHGSARTSSCKEWIKAVNPAYVFVSADRSGSLDINKRTGHRLPQELTLDIIRANSSRLASNIEKHSYIASYNPTDYEDYNKQNKKDAPLKDVQLTLQNPYSKKKEIGWPRGWFAIATTRAIFTTLVKMGGAYTDDESEADQGCQYELTIDDGGNIGVAATETFDGTMDTSP